MRNKLPTAACQLFIVYLAAMFLFSCAVEVGNPHPEVERGKKASIDISILREGTFAFDRIDLNIAGFSLISSTHPDSAVTFPLQKQVSLDNSDADRMKTILSSTTTAQGSYDAIRVNFSRQGVGDIVLDARSIPIVMPTEAKFIDVPLQFVLSPGRKTNITLGFDHQKLLQESLDEQGQVISYTFGNEFATEVGQEAIGDSGGSQDLTLARAYRLTVLEVNDGRQVYIQNLRLKLGNEWESNSFSGPNGRIGTNPVTVSESSSQRSNYGWRALSGGTWRSSHRTFDREDRRALDPEGEFIQFDFSLPVSITGVEFESGDDDEYCATIYRVERINSSGQWESIPGAASEMSACTLVNITW